MNKKTILNKKNHKIYFIGGARGTNTFYLVNKISEIAPNARIIKTGAVIQQLIKKMKLGELDNLTISQYYQFVEPMLVNEIISHLEHGDVILDTHFYYLIPAISIIGLAEIKENFSEAKIILIDDDPISIYKRSSMRNDPWFKDITNIKNDLYANREYHKWYISTLAKDKVVKDIVIHSNQLNSLETINSIKEMI